MLEFMMIWTSHYCIFYLGIFVILYPITMVGVLIQTTGIHLCLANIERIRIARNRCVHSSSPSLSKTEFNSIWSDVRSSVVDIDAFLSNGNHYEKAVDFLRHETMDSERDELYWKELRRQAEEDRETRDMVQDIKGKPAEMHKTS